MWPLHAGHKSGSHKSERLVSGVDPAVYAAGITAARISRVQNLITNDGFTHIQPLLLRAAGSLREFPSCLSPIFSPVM